MGKPKVLITNDDGIESYFLKALVEAHLDTFDVFVVAPAGEQSWIGRAISRHKDLEVKEVSDYGCPAWSVSGTPTDCVNIALGHILKGSHPDVVISGINVGYNCSLPFILSSGTIAGAIEGAFWGIPSAAFSKSIPSEQFIEIRDNNGQCKGVIKSSLHAAAAIAEQFTTKLIGTDVTEKPSVLNVNFPSPTSLNTPIEKTVPGIFHLESLFAENPNGKYNFQFTEKLTKIRKAENTDAACVTRGHISQTILDFSTLGLQ